ncbi:MAG: dihydrofolate reductase [Lachnospiraceae bacterium]
MQLKYDRLKIRTIIRRIEKMYITEIGKNITGDTYFPDFNEHVFEKETVLRVDGEIPYTYVTYHRKRR